ncbi:MAG: hypothetical protein AMQ22_02080 [Candidatus Methanofastidiosum methylothiophilum]|uniref:Uncharacterized protein n=1 Tax=Candidatus Methanofastidiosum methylothiophilum TaxID=1705564 RepID=A0A150IP23_9EURY|nr:MAG: hypothetical protein AMQ22_02080 [Candidatus Methanofastidiosum methylthiophilus]
MNVLERFDKLEHDLKQHPYLQINRVEGRHCIDIKPQKDETGEYSFSAILTLECLQNRLDSYGLPGLVVGDPTRFKRNLYELRVCIEQPQYQKVLSDKIKEHV